MRYEGYASRISTWWLRCLIEAKLKTRRVHGVLTPKLILEEYYKRWDHTMTHFTNECDKYCPCKGTHSVHVMRFVILTN